MTFFECGGAVTSFFFFFLCGNVCMGGAISSQPLSVSAILAAFAWNWVQAVQLHIMSLPTYDNITQGGITIYDWTWLLLNFHTHTPISPHPHTQPHTHIPTSPHSLSIPPLCFLSILTDFIILHPFYHTASRQSNFGLLVALSLRERD